jgi:hypothetical protein
MKRLFAIPFLFCSLPLMAQTINSAAVENYPLNWTVNVDQSNSVTNGVFVFGYTASNNVPAAIPNLNIIGTFPGYDDNGNVIYTTNYLFGLKQLRQAYPNQANYDMQSDGSGGFKYRVAISDSIFATDSNLTLNMLASTYATNSTAAGITVTNNSTAAYVKGALKWAYPGWQRITNNTMVLQAVGFDRSAQNGRPFRTVRFNWTDQHSHSVTNFVNNEVMDWTDPDAEHFALWMTSMDISTASQGDLLTCNVAGFPWRGDTNAVVDSATTGFSQPTSQLAPITNVCDRSNLLGFCVTILDTTNGVDTNGTVLAGPLNLGALPKPYATYANAVKALHNTNNTLFGHNDLSSCILYVTNCNFTNIDTSGTTGSGTNNLSWFTITNFPGVPRNNVIFAGSGAGISGTTGNKLHFSGVTITNTGANFVWNGQAYFWLDNCDLQQGSSAEWGGSTKEYATWNTVESTYTGLGFSHRATDASEWSIVRGNTIISNSLFLSHYYCYIGNSGACSLNGKGTGTTSPDPAIIYNNAMTVYNNAAAPIITVTQVTNAMFMVQNIFESTVSLGGSLVFMDGDASLFGTDSTNINLWYNTIVGGRINMLYNDTTTNNPIRILCDFSSNLSQDSNIKSDTFGTGNAVRTNNWSSMWMSHSQGNLSSKLITPGNFYPDFIGVYSYWDNASLATNLQFVNDASHFGNGLGNGNYHLLSQSLGCIYPTGLQRLPFDFDGNNRGLHDPPGVYASACPAKGAGFFAQ